MSTEPGTPARGDHPALRHAAMRARAKRREAERDREESARCYAKADDLRLRAMALNARADEMDDLADRIEAGDA